MRDYAILTLFLNCGMRLSELCGMNLSRLNLRERVVRIVGKGNKERQIHLNDACVAALEAYLAVRPAEGVKGEHRDAVFLSRQKRRINGRTVELMMKKYLKDAQLNEQRYTPHKLRHTAATLMFSEGGVDVRTLKEILGHEQLNTTQIYTHVGDRQLARGNAEKSPCGPQAGRRPAFCAGARRALEKRGGKPSAGRLCAARAGRQGGARGGAGKDDLFFAPFPRLGTPFLESAKEENKKSRPGRCRQKEAGAKERPEKLLLFRPLFCFPLPSRLLCSGALFWDFGKTGAVGLTPYATRPPQAWCRREVPRERGTAGRTRRRRRPTQWPSSSLFCHGCNAAPSP